jgi:hypothetical protein
VDALEAFAWREVITVTNPSVAEDSLKVSVTVTGPRFRRIRHSIPMAWAAMAGRCLSLTLMASRSAGMSRSPAKRRTAAMAASGVAS